jgi:hypothetical protein
MIDQINKEMLSVGSDLSSDLAGLYALLALTKGVETTLEDVHDAWAVWTATVRGRPDHRSLVPFDELDRETQEMDRIYMDGIHRAARAVLR